MTLSYACVTAAWQAHEAELLAYLTHRVGDRHLAEDLLQDTFLKAMRQGERFCAVGLPRAWLFQVARNALVDHARLQRPGAELSEDLPAAVDEPAAVDALAECLERVLPRMAAEDADILRACDLLGLKQQDYAERQGLTLPAAKARLRRARLRLRALLVVACGVRFDENRHVCCMRPSPPPVGP